MSTTLEASLKLEIAGYQASLAKATKETARFREQIQKQGRGLGNDVLGGIGKFVAGGVMIGLGKQALDTVVNLDRLERGMTTLEGSSEAASVRLAQLRQDARLPGLDFEQAVKGDIRLRAVGISADLSRRAMIEMGNALSLAGGTASDLDDVLLALTQIASKGKVSAEEINQIAERVPQVRAVMKSVFGTADTEALQKMNIEATAFIERLVGGFGGLSRAKAGLDEDLTDITSSLKMLVAEGAGPLVKELVPAFRDLATVIAENKDVIGAFGRFASNEMQLFLADLKGGIQGAKEMAEALGMMDAEAPRAKAPRGGLIRDTSRARIALASPEKKTTALSFDVDEKTIKAGEKIEAAQRRLNDLKTAQLPTAERLTALQNELSLATFEKASQQQQGNTLAAIDAEKRQLEIGKQIVDLRKEQEQDQQTSARVQEARAVMDIEMQIVREQAQSGDLDNAKIAAFRDQLNVLQLSEQIQNQLRLTESDALKMAREKVSLERTAASIAKDKLQARSLQDLEAEMQIEALRAAGKNKQADAQERMMRVTREARSMESMGIDSARARMMAETRIGNQDRINLAGSAGDSDTRGGRRKILGFTPGQEWRGATLSAAARGGGGLGGSDGRRRFGTLADYDAMQAAPSQYDLLQQRGRGGLDAMHVNNAAKSNPDTKVAETLGKLLEATVRGFFGG